jgi:23S rRNA (cytidine1920-2'-O)/16S rRNA (cytidine1409-2'-O)-methyltransferase
LTEDGEAICLIKPQFEAGRESVGKKGVVRDRQTHKSVLDTFLIHAEEAGFTVQGLTFSPVTGPEGNIEYLGWINSGGESEPIDTEAIVSASHAELLRSGGDE